MLNKDAQSPSQPQGAYLQIISILKKEYPNAGCSLNFSNPLELLIATILSAQCTDVRVNQITERLFEKYKTATDYAEVDQAKLEEDIRSTGFYKNKTKNIIKCCQSIIEKYNGQVPSNLEDLVGLDGVGRKTANVVLGTYFGIPSVVVDTHVGRLAGRLGLSTQKNPVKIEFDLMRIIPESDWIILSHLLILHGRNICKARKPQCNRCCINRLCPSAN